MGSQSRTLSKSWKRLNIPVAQYAESSQSSQQKNVVMTQVKWHNLIYQVVSTLHY